MILITGGAGFVGSYTALELLKSNCEIVVVDNLEHSNIETINTLKKFGNIEFVNADLNDKSFLNTFFQKYNIDTVFHMSGLTQIKDKVCSLEKYCQSNTDVTKNILDAMVKNNVRRIIFSSSSSVYGQANYLPIDEIHPLKPLSPYGISKLKAENIIKKYNKEYGVQYIIFRYFNVTGGNSKYNIGKDTRLISNIIKSIKNNETFDLISNIKNGTNIRDYVDVQDIAYAQKLALNYIQNSNNSEILNLGSGKGMSTMDIIHLCENTLNKKIKYKYRYVNLNDAEKLIADTTKIKYTLGWEAKIPLKKSIIEEYKFFK